MIRRDFLGLIGAAALAMPVSAETRAGPFRVGVLFSSTSSTGQARGFPIIRQKLEELGYVEGQNISFDVRGGNEYDRLPGLAAELIVLRPNLIVAITTPALLAVFKAKPPMPVIFTGIGWDPVQLGVVQSLPHPGGNFTGVVNNNAELGSKRLQVLRDLLPQAKRVAVFINRKNNPAGSQTYIDELNAAAAKLGFEIINIDAQSADGLPSAFEKAVELKAEALFGTADPMFTANRPTILALAHDYKLPVIYNFRLEVADGGLIAYGPDADAQFRSAAPYVDKVLQGANPADLPVEQATKMALIINLKTAKALGLTVPQVLLAQADDVIE